MNPFTNLFEIAASCYGSHGSTAGALVAGGLMAARKGAVQGDPSTVPPIDRHLHHALKASPSTLAGELVKVQQLLKWYTCAFDPIPYDIGIQMAFCQIIGPGGLIHSDDMRAGLFLQQPNLYYPFHSHEAEELYLIVSGTAEWRTPDMPFAPRRVGQFAHHPSWVPHAMQTASEPLLAMWSWIGNIEAQTYRMDDHLDS